MNGFRQSWKSLVIGAALVAAVAATGCSDDTHTHDPIAPHLGSVSVHFDNQVSGADLVVDITQFLYTNAAGNNYSVDRLQYFVSDITLQRNDGSTYGVNGYHYRDATDVDTRTWIIDGVPEGTYTAISFTFGLNADKNKSGPPISDDPKASASMTWPPPWGGGWHYMILEGKYKESGTGTEYGYRTHSGRRNMTGTDPMAMPPGPDTFGHHHDFRVTLTPASSFTVDGDSWEIRAIMNLNGWYGNPQINLETLFPQGTGGIMINLPVQDQLQANGPACFSVTPAVKQ